jgi:PAS domain S-box-containing protein
VIHHSFEFNRLVQSPQALATMGTACLLFCLGILAVNRERGSVESIAFFKQLAAIGLWLFGFSWMYASSDADLAYRWAKIAYIGLAMLPAAVFELSTLMLQDLRESRKMLQCLWATSFFFLVVILATDFQFDSMYHYHWGFYPRYTLTSIPFVFYFIGTLAAVFIRYVMGYRSARPGTEQRKHGRLTILAYTVSIIGLVDYLPSFGIAVYPFGFVAVIIFTLILFYIISRYRFFAITPSFAADSIIQIMDSGLMVLDNEGIIRVTNCSLGRLFRAGEGPITGMRPSEVATDAEGFGTRLETLLLQGELRNTEIDLHDEDGSIRSFSLNSSIMRDPYGEQLAIVCVVTDITARKKAEKERERLIGQLQEALANVRQLSGMLPICAACKKIRDDQGYWQQIESYLKTHSDAEFTHSMCPDCVEKTRAELRRFRNNMSTTP